MNMRITKLEEKDLELISGGKLQAKVKERIEKSTFNTIGYRSGQVVFSVIGGALGALLSANVSYSPSYTESTTEDSRTTTKTIPGHWNKISGTPALVLTTGAVGIIVGMKIWDELANKLF